MSCHYSLYLTCWHALGFTAGGVGSQKRGGAQGSGSRKRLTTDNIWYHHAQTFIHPRVAKIRSAAIETVQYPANTGKKSAVWSRPYLDGKWKGCMQRDNFSQPLLMLAFDSAESIHFRTTPVIRRSFGKQNHLKALQSRGNHMPPLHVLFWRTITAAQTTPVWVPYLNFEKNCHLCILHLCFVHYLKCLEAGHCPYLKATNWIIEHTIFCSSACATGFLLVPKSFHLHGSVLSLPEISKFHIPWIQHHGLRFACQVSLHTLAALWRGENIVGAKKWWQPLLFIGIKNV